MIRGLLAILALCASVISAHGTEDFCAVVLKTPDDHAGGEGEVAMKALGSITQKGGASK